MNLFSILGKKSPPKIFICYRRRGEGAGFGGRIADKLVKHFGPNQCFRDIENIEKGTDFVESIKRATSICQLLLVVIGPDWTTMKDENGNLRLEDKNDFVRLEVSTALERNIRVIPVLVGGAKMPTEDQLPDNLKALERRQSHELTDQRWNYDSDELIKAIESMGIKGKSPKEQEARKRKQKIIGAVVLTSLVMILAVGIYFKLNPSPKNDTRLTKTPNHSIVEPNEVVKTTKKEILEKNSEPKKKKPNYKQEKSSVKNAVMLASNLEAEALITRNHTILNQVFTGDALRNSNAYISKLDLVGVYEFNILESQTFGEIEVYEEEGKLLAEAQLTETWSGHAHRASDQLCLSHRPSHVIPQTLFLEKKKDNWYVASISHHTTTDAIVTQCGQYNCPLLSQAH